MSRNRSGPHQRLRASPRARRSERRLFLGSRGRRQAGSLVIQTPSPERPPPRLSSKGIHALRGLRVEGQPSSRESGAEPPARYLRAFSTFQSSGGYRFSRSATARSSEKRRVGSKTPACILSVYSRSRSVRRKNGSARFWCGESWLWVGRRRSASDGAE